METVALQDFKQRRTHHGFGKVLLLASTSPFELGFGCSLQVRFLRRQTPFQLSPSLLTLPETTLLTLPETTGCAMIIRFRTHIRKHIQHSVVLHSCPFTQHWHSCALDFISPLKHSSSSTPKRWFGRRESW